MKRATIFVLFTIGALVPLSFWCGSLWRLETQKAIASHHAVWIARYWEEGKSISAICNEIAREQGVHILQEEWDSGDAPDAVLGPVVGGKRVCVRRDQSIYWRVAQ